MNTPKSPWRLVTEATGKQIWTLEPRTGLSSSDLSDFGFAKDQNCNSADAVYRSSKVGDAFVPKGSDTIERGWSYLCQLQANSGHWPGDYGGPMFLLPGLVFAAYITESPFAKVEQDLMRQYMLNHQNADGGWGLHIEGQSTMFGTVLQYVALRLLGEPPSARHMLRASVWIKEHGGAVTIPSWGKFYMSLLGLYEWRGNNSLFPEMWLLPEWLPVHPSQYWCHTRMVYLPMAYCAAVRLRIPENELIRKLRSEIHTTQYEYIDWKKARNQCAVTDLYHPHSKLLRMLNRALNLYEATPIKSWREKAKSFILEYINAEDEQTNYINIGPVNQVINSICVWHAYGKESETFRKHRERWSEYLWIAEDGMKMQGYNGSQLWDTAFAFQALCESGISDDFRNNYNSAWEFINRSQVREAVKEHIKYYRHDSVGGWPFSTAPHGWPITDCTAEGLKCMMLAVESDLLSKAEGASRMKQSCDLLLSFQNRDGGWASYEKTRGPKWLEKLNPAEIFGDIMVDYSYTECTSACLQALIHFQKLFPEYRIHELEPAIEKGIRFILNKQRSDGSWYGSWAVCFTYGTWFACEALSAYALRNKMSTMDVRPSLERAGQFLLSKQNHNGGWGESFESSVKKEYIATPDSQVVNTSWALMSLLRIQEVKRTEGQILQLATAKNFLEAAQLPNGDFPQRHINGVFNNNCMISYTNYRNIFPLWALARYRLFNEQIRKTIQPQ